MELFSKVIITFFKKVALSGTNSTFAHFSILQKQGPLHRRGPFGLSQK
jgi:hypothetical protein